MKRLSLALTLPLLVGPVDVSAQATTTVVPFSTSGTIDCTGERVELEGTFQIINHVRADGAGALHVTDNWNVKAEGSGDLGSEYRFNYSDNYGYNVAADDLPHTFTNTAIINIVGKGQAATLQQKVVIHTTINANGEPTSSVDWFELTCR